MKSPDKIKYGGGLRVKQITMFDGWLHNSEGVYGQYFDYTTIEEGKSISSGVAAFEPFIGGEENALRYAKTFTESIPLKTNNNLYFEYPVNESYYPGPQVGYSKVTIMSIASAKKAGKEVLHIDVLENGEMVSLLPENINNYGTTGATVNEFFTAKDYPVRSYETEKLNKPFRLKQNIPTIGSFSFAHLSSSQGYSIITNDMHGKPRRITKFRQSLSGELEPSPVSWMQYNYFDRSSFYQNERIMELSNTFIAENGKTLRKASLNEEDQSSSEIVALGQEIELFADLREFRDISVNAGANFNIDFVAFSFPIPSKWPDLGGSFKQLRTIVTNKVIFQPRILKSIEAYDEGSILTSEHLEWDKETGAPLLTVTNNNFDAPIYSLQVPAFHKYLGMGGAYKNLGFAFSMTAIRPHKQKEGYYAFNTLRKNLQIIFPGDELLLFRQEEGKRQPIGKAVFIGGNNSDLVFHAPQNLQMVEENLIAKVVRSGY